MSSMRRILASRANGLRSRGPATPEGKLTSSRNALRHGLLARRIVLEEECREGFDSLAAQHFDRFAPQDGVEVGIIEEMAAAAWRLRRAWAIETRLLQNNSTGQPPGDPLDRLTQAFTDPASYPGLALLHRYETRLHLMYQRALHNMILMRAVPAPAPVPCTLAIPNEPSPENGHSPNPRPQDVSRR